MASVTPLQQAGDDQHVDIAAKLRRAHVAQAQDRDALEDTVKSDITSVMVLGEGAFGIVDLVMVDAEPQPLLCVRKKLLKQSQRNKVDPETEVIEDRECMTYKSVALYLVLPLRIGRVERMNALVCECVLAFCCAKPCYVKEVHLLQIFQASPFVVQMWSHVVGLYDYTLLLEYCPYGSLEKLLSMVIDSRAVRQGGCQCTSWFSSSQSALASGSGAFTELEARFFMACAVLGLEEMHNKGVLHRDIKPSNLLLDYNRYAKLADLGLAKQMGTSHTAHSKCGTPCYMAPEVVACGEVPEGRPGGAPHRGYSWAADVWSLGIMTWELVAGLPPRWAPMSWYVTAAPHYPQGFSQNLRSLLTGMLAKRPSERLTLAQVKTHAWFSGMDWQALKDRQIEAPHFLELRMSHSKVLGKQHEQQKTQQLKPP